MRLALEDNQSPSVILWHLPVIYDSSYLSAFPVPLNQSSSLLKRLVWSMILIAAKRSSTVSAVTLPASFDTRISLRILRRTVSAQGNSLYTELIKIGYCLNSLCLN